MSCGAEVEVVIPRPAYVAVIAVVTVALGVFVAALQLKNSGSISPTTFHWSLLALAISLNFGGNYAFRYFWRYRTVAEA